jgi:hypothetical protein
MVLAETIEGLTAMIGGLTKTILDAQSRYEVNFQKTVAVGKDSELITGKLISQFEGMGVALEGAMKIFQDSVKSGVALTTENRRLFTTIRRFGLNLGTFTETMGTMEQVFGMSTDASTQLARNMVDLGVTWTRDSTQLVRALDRLAEPMGRITAAYGVGATGDFANVVAGLGARMGPQAMAGVGDFLSKFTGTTTEEFQRAAILGLKPGEFAAGASIEGAVQIASQVVGRAQSFGVGGAGTDPRLLQFFTQQTGMTAMDLNIARQLLALTEADLALSAESAAEEARKRQITHGFTDAWNNIMASLQTQFLPIIADISEIIAKVFNPAAGFFQHFVKVILGPVADYFEQTKTTLKSADIAAFFDGMTLLVRTWTAKIEEFFENDMPSMGKLWSKATLVMDNIINFMANFGARWTLAGDVARATEGGIDTASAWGKIMTMSPDKLQAALSGGLGARWGLISDMAEKEGMWGDNLEAGAFINFVKEKIGADVDASQFQDFSHYDFGTGQLGATSGKFHKSAVENEKDEILTDAIRELVRQGKDANEIRKILMENELDKLFFWRRNENKAVGSGDAWSVRTR